MPTDEELESMLYSVATSMKQEEMMREQINLLITRYYWGDVNATEAMIELGHIRHLVDRWQWGEPSPFGEID